MKSIQVIILQLLAGLSFDSLLKYKDVKLNYITYPDILLFVVKGIRGGSYMISTITKRYAKANIKDCIDY